MKIFHYIKIFIVLTPNIDQNLFQELKKQKTGDELYQAQVPAKLRIAFKLVLPCTKSEVVFHMQNKIRVVFHLNKLRLSSY